MAAGSGVCRCSHWRWGALDARHQSKSDRAALQRLGAGWPRRARVNRAKHRERPVCGAGFYCAPIYNRIELGAGGYTVVPSDVATTAELGGANDFTHVGGYQILEQTCGIREEAQGSNFDPLEASRINRAALSTGPQYQPGRSINRAAATGPPYHSG